jgi:hypothetical protein
MGCNAATVVQGLSVMVEGYMNIPVTIQHHADDVMGILHIPFILCAVQCPLSGMEVPFSKSQEPFRIIVTDVLRAKNPTAKRPARRSIGKLIN